MSKREIGSHIEVKCTGLSLPDQLLMLLGKRLVPTGHGSWEVLSRALWLLSTLLFLLQRGGQVGMCVVMPQPAPPVSICPPHLGPLLFY